MSQSPRLWYRLVPYYLFTTSIIHRPQKNQHVSVADVIPVLALMILSLSSSLPVLATAKSSPDNAALTHPYSTWICSTTILFGSLGTFTVCISQTTLHVDEPVGITMTMTNTAGGPPPGYLLCCTVFLNITSNGTLVFSDSQGCSTCTLAQGQSRTFSFAWIPTKPLGIDNVQGTVYWDFGCRLQGCAIVSPPPGITSVNATVQNPDPDPSGGGGGPRVLNT